MNKAILAALLMTASALLVVPSVNAETIEVPAPIPTNICENITLEECTMILNVLEEAINSGYRYYVEFDTYGTVRVDCTYNRLANTSIIVASTNSYVAVGIEAGSPPIQKELYRVNYSVVSPTPRRATSASGLANPYPLFPP